MIKLARPNVRVAHRGRCDRPECTGSGRMVGVVYLLYSSTPYQLHLYCNHFVWQSKCEQTINNIYTRPDWFTQIFMCLSRFVEQTE